MSDVYLNNKYVGTVENGKNFTDLIIDERRKNNLTSNLNVHYNEQGDEVRI